MSQNNKYLDYQGLVRLVENIEKKYAPIQAVLFKSTVEDLTQLPPLNTVKAGWMYNAKVGGITTNDFVEGAGHIVADGENIAAVELIVDYTPVASPAATDDPKALGWYEVDEVVDVYVLTTDTTVDGAKTYYSYDGATYTEVSPIGTENPSEEGWYEKTQVTTYKLSQDRLPVAGTTYYEAGTVMKWDLMGGTFDLEGRYLEFGKEFPQKPESKMVDGRTFLFMGEDVKVYTAVEIPEGRPAENDYFEGTFSAVVDPAADLNPKQVPLYEKVESYTVVTPVGDEVPSDLGWYERTGDGTEADPYVYTLSADSTVDNSKTYCTKNPDTYVRTTDAEVATGKTYYTGIFVASEDTSVDPTKVYYTEDYLYKKGGIYEYDATEKEWTLQSSGGSDVVPIPLKDIDDLFI